MLNYGNYIIIMNQHELFNKKFNFTIFRSYILRILQSNHLYFINQIIPKELITIFDPIEFEMILNGLPFINVDDWEANSVYKGVYTV